MRLIDLQKQGKDMPKIAQTNLNLNLHKKHVVRLVPETLFKNNYTENNFTKIKDIIQ